MQRVQLGNIKRKKRTAVSKKKNPPNVGNDWKFQPNPGKTHPKVVTHLAHAEGTCWGTCFGKRPVCAVRGQNNVRSGKRKARLTDTPTHTHTPHDLRG